MRRQVSAILGLLLLAGTLALPAQQAHASDDWCSDDPIVQVNHTRFDLTVQVPVQQKANVIMVAVYVPVPPHSDVHTVKVDQASFPEVVVYLPQGGNPMQSFAVALSRDPSHVIPVRVLTRVLGSGDHTNG